MKRAVLLLVLLLGCGSSTKAPSPLPGTVFVNGTPDERARYKRHRAEWALYFGRPAPHVTKVTFHSARVLLRGGQFVQGWASGDEIELAAGAHYSFHELCHVAFVDYNHSHPDWAAWDQHQQALK